MASMSLFAYPHIVSVIQQVSTMSATVGFCGWFQEELDMVHILEKCVSRPRDGLRNKSNSLIPAECPLKEVQKALVIQVAL